MQKLGALKSAFQDMGETMPGFDKVALMKYPEIDRINPFIMPGIVQV